MVRKNTTTGYIEYWDPVGALWRTADSAPELYSFSGTIQFSACSQTGPYGPILSDATSSYTGQPFASTWLNNLELFNVVAGVQFWRVPRNGTYTIRCAGARSGPCTFGGLGRDLTATFSLTAGEWLRIIVGQRGEGNSGVYGGGGGASYQTANANGGNGGSGVVILKYVDSRTITIGAGLTGSTASAGGFKVTTITAGTGNVSFA
jgi:hypothetical protein